jgi:hypothetical protein
MPTGAFWNTTDDPDKPWGPLDSDATITFPIELEAWLAQLGAGYASHTIKLAAGSPLEIVSSIFVAASVTLAVTVKVAAAATFIKNQQHGFTIALVCDDAVQRDERTLFLKLVDR